MCSQLHGKDRASQLKREGELGVRNPTQATIDELSKKEDKVAEFEHSAEHTHAFPLLSSAGAENVETAQ